VPSTLEVYATALSFSPAWHKHARKRRHRARKTVSVVKSGVFVKAQRIANAAAALVRHHATSATERHSIQTMQAALLGTCRRHSCSLKNLAFTGSCQECGWVSLEQHRADKTVKGGQQQSGGKGPKQRPSGVQQQPGGKAKGGKAKGQSAKDNPVMQQMQDQQQQFLMQQKAHQEQILAMQQQFHFQSTVASNQPAGLSSWSPNGVGSMPPTAVQQHLQQDGFASRPWPKSVGARERLYQAAATEIWARAQQEPEVGQDESTHQKAKINRLDAKIKALKVIADMGDEEASVEILQLQSDRQVACEAITNLKSPSEQIRILTGALAQKKAGLASAEDHLAKCKVAVTEAEEKVGSGRAAVDKVAVKLAQVQATMAPNSAPLLDVNPQAMAALASLRTSLQSAGGSVTWDRFPQEQLAALKTILDQAAAVSEQRQAHSSTMDVAQVVAPAVVSPVTPAFSASSSLSEVSPSSAPAALHPSTPTRQPHATHGVSSGVATPRTPQEIIDASPPAKVAKTTADWSMDLTGQGEQSVSSSSSALVAQSSNTLAVQAGQQMHLQQQFQMQQLPMQQLPMQQQLQMQHMMQMPMQHQLQMMQQQQPCQVFQMPSMPPGVPIACGDSQGNFPILVNPAAFGENPSYGPISSRVSAPSRPSPMMALGHQA